MKKFILLLVICYNLLAQEIFIIVPGTWASESGWHTPGSNFYKALQTASYPEKKKVISFYWSGYNNDASRQKAGERLAELIQSYTPDTLVNLITHSHGGNVGIIASHILSQRVKDEASDHEMCYYIHCFYALATPVNHECYFPAMDVIDYFYHFFSFSDFVQPIFGMYQRLFPNHERLANISILINDNQPGHTDMHSPCLAYWLPQIHTYLRNLNSSNFQFFSFDEPGIIRFYENSAPTYAIDLQRSQLIEEDRQLIHHLSYALLRNRIMGTNYETKRTK